MFRKNQSGQFVYFNMVSAISGNPVTGGSGQISGRKALDGLSGMIVLSGNIIELGGGAYRANLYDFDINGNNFGFLFTASGCVPVGFTGATIDNVSGQLYLSSGQAASLNSGQSVIVNSGQLSGQVVNLLSGNQVGVWSGTQVNLFSGTQVNIWSGQLSGFQITTRTNLDKSGYGVGSGDVFVASGTIQATVTSGAVWLSSGQAVSLNSGQSVNVYSGQLSGFQLTARTVLDKSGYAVQSGDVFVASGTIQATLASGVVFLASGQAVSLNSGEFVNVYSGQLSGFQINLLSGNQVGVWSGTNVNQFSGSVSKFKFASGVLDYEIPKNVLTLDYTALSGVISVASGISGRCLGNQGRKLINKFDLTTKSGYLTVFQEDDTTVAYEQAVTSVSGAAPITSLDTR